MNILIIDGMNLFIRNYVVNCDKTLTGYPIGGLTGFIRSLGKLLCLSKFDLCIIAWDGKDGSIKRRLIYKNYKDNRKPLKPIYSLDLSQTEERSIRYVQLALLKNILKDVSLFQIEINELEADDVISYIVNEKFLNSKKIIYSTDKDFYQLLNNNVIIYNSRKIITCNKLLNDHNIFYENYILYKVLCGDKSDNIDGIKGFGEKTVVKLFPFLSNQEKIELSKIFLYAQDKICKNKLYEKVVQSKNLIERNYKLMNLSYSDFSIMYKEKIDQILENDLPLFSKIKLKTSLIKQSIISIDDFYLDRLSILNTKDENA